MNITDVDSRIGDLTNNAVSVDMDEYSVVGLRSWLTLSVNAESDWTLNIGILDDGTIVAAEGYGPSALLIKPEPVEQIFNENHFIYFISECEKYATRCVDDDCDNWGDTDCSSHVDKGGHEAWLLLEAELLPNFK